MRVPRQLVICVVGVVAAALWAAAPASADAPGGTWKSDTPSGVKRQEVTYVAAAGRLYLAGGRVTLHQAFDPSTHVWSTVAPLPEALDHIQAAELGGKIYYVGGLSGYPGQSFGDVYAYDPLADTFTQVASLPDGRDRGAGGIAAYDGKLYLAGGFHAGHSVAFVDSYDPVAGSWTSLPDMPEPRDHLSVSIVAGKLYAIGGRTFGVAFRSENDVYDIGAGTWTTGLAALPTLRSGAATAVFGPEIAVIGGEGFGMTFSTAEAYDTVSDTWRTLTPMPSARHGIQAAMVGGRAYIAGGGLKMGGGAPTDLQQVLMLGDPDCRVRRMSGSTYAGNNIYNLDGTGQTRSATIGAGKTTAFAFSLQNDAADPDSFVVSGPGSRDGFTVRYLTGLSGGTDVTADVVAGTFRTPVLAHGAVYKMRLSVHAGSTLSGASSLWLLTATSPQNGSVADACGGAVTTP